MLERIRVPTWLPTVSCWCRPATRRRPCLWWRKWWSIAIWRTHSSMIAHSHLNFRVPRDSDWLRRNPKKHLKRFWSIGRSFDWRDSVEPRAHPPFDRRRGDRRRRVEIVHSKGRKVRDSKWWNSSKCSVWSHPRGTPASRWRWEATDNHARSWRPRPVSSKAGTPSPSPSASDSCEAAA